MGWFVGNSGDTVTVEFEGGLSSTSAYLGLRDIYAIHKATTTGYTCEIAIGVYASKIAKENNEPNIKVKGLNNSVFVSITEEEFMTALGNVSIAEFLMSKLIPAVEIIKNDWNGKLIADF